jgi:hypothetical protein
MDLLVLQVLVPGRPEKPGPGASIARWLLYVRSHYLRMPLTLLIPHLWRKAVTRPTAAA